MGTSSAADAFIHGDELQEQGKGQPGTIDGEYMVRLRLKGSPPQGHATCEVVDLAVLGQPAGHVPTAAFAIEQLQLEIVADTPPGTQVEAMLRTGSTPAFSPRHWTAWTPAALGVSDRPHRFAQWQLRLVTNNAGATPTVTSVAFDVRSQDEAGSLATVTLQQPDLLSHSAYLHTYLPPPLTVGEYEGGPKGGFRVDRLLKQYRLEDVIAPGKTQLEQIALLRDWVHSQWLGWQSAKYPFGPSWDPLEILDAVKTNSGYGMCTHYSAVFVGCASALGWVARSVVIDHHWYEILTET